jgi:hypothetical protein
MSLFAKLLSNDLNNKHEEENIIPSLTELDFLTDLFSFFTSITAKYSRRVCRWWNDLLSKDSQTCRHLLLNNDGKEALFELHKEVEVHRELHDRLSKKRQEIKELSTKIDGKNLASNRGRKKIKDIDNHLLHISLTNQNLTRYSIESIYIKQLGKLITKSFGNKTVNLYSYNFHTSIESDCIHELIIISSDPLNLRILSESSVILPARSMELFILDSTKIKFDSKEFDSIIKNKKVDQETWFSYTTEMMTWLRTRGFVEDVDWIYYKDPDEVGRNAYFASFTGYPGLHAVNALGYTG